MRLLLTLLLTGCYSLSDYWEDVATAQCQCAQPSQRDACVDEQLAALETSGLLEACGDEEAPASWRDMIRWHQEYTAECDQSEAIPPGADQALPTACD